MDAIPEQRMTHSDAATASPPQPAALARRLFIALSLVALTYALLAGLRTVTDWDLGWQLATGRWVAQHHRIPSVDVLSYTAQGRPWIYPAGSGLIFYALYLVGKYTLLSWLGAAACVATIALTLRRGSPITAVLAILAVPRTALRTTPRADMFTVVLFAAFLTLLWQQHETGRARMWLLPLLMVLWVNLHPGLAAGLALIGGYVVLEGLEMVWPERRHAAQERLRQTWPWLIATLAAPLLNPWGGRIYSAFVALMTPMAAQSQIMEWAPANLSWATIVGGLSLRSPNTFVLLLVVVAIAVPIALLRRQLGAAVLLSGAALLGIRHIRLQVLFSVMVVIVAGAVLTSALRAWQDKVIVMEDARVRSVLAVGACCLIVVLVFVWSADLVTQRTYLGRTDVAEFGTGLGWWFPEGAAGFIEREKIPGEIFNSYTEGGYFSWRLGPSYRDYVDGRFDRLGPESMRRSIALMGSLPDSPAWQREAQRYNINAIIVPLGRYQALEQFSVLRQFCASQTWPPVYLDETSAVFMRRTPATEGLLQRLQIDCGSVPLPAVVPGGNDSKAFNQWANAAAVLKVLGRNAEALSATARALSIFPDSAYVHFTRADLLAQTGNWRDAEQHYLLAAALEPNAASWATLAKIYEQENRLPEATQAWEHAAELSPEPYIALLSLGYDYLDTRRPQDALKAFDRASTSVPARSETGGGGDPAFYANLAHGRAMAWKSLGDLKRAIAFEEQTVGITPDRSDDWLELANLYEQVGRSTDALRARERATQLMSGANNWKPQ